ncbi:hypothetical protein GCM10012289_24680 [Nonomuraea cavernae]|uniref:ABC-2 type transporter transmembrane domain-containing protein n=2 Tax=Nonomuraea cavernae TaxID=2045107 RepID=A0A917YWW3_9ACTN|nr:hypothetical protein GCM10012289_24680 [Nonomuraea cavernae]
MLGGGDGSRFNARYAVADLDRGPDATAFVGQVLEPLERRGTVSLQRVSSVQDGARLLERKEADAVFVIPAGFSSATTPEVIGGAHAPIAVQVAREMAQAFAMERQSIRLAVLAASRGLPVDEERDSRLARRAQEVAAPLTLVSDTSATRRQLDTATYHAAGMAIFFQFFVAMFVMAAVFEERRSRVLARVLAAPVPRAAVLGGKALCGILIGLMSMAVVVAASTWLMGARWGPPLGVVALVIAGVLAVTGIAAAVAGFSNTSEQAANRISVVAMVLGVFGGALFPIPQLGVLEVASHLTPHRWFLTGLADLAAGLSPGALLTPVLVLLAIAAATGGLALTRVGGMTRT